MLLLNALLCKICKWLINQTDNLKDPIKKAHVRPVILCLSLLFASFKILNSYRAKWDLDIFKRYFGIKIESHTINQPPLYTVMNCVMHTFPFSEYGQALNIQVSLPSCQSALFQAIYKSETKSSIKISPHSSSRCSNMFSVEEIVLWLEVKCVHTVTMKW